MEKKLAKKPGTQVISIFEGQSHKTRAIWVPGTQPDIFFPTSPVPPSEVITLINTVFNFGARRPTGLNGVGRGVGPPPWGPCGSPENFTPWKRRLGTWKLPFLGGKLLDLGSVNGRKSVGFHWGFHFTPKRSGVKWATLGPSCVIMVISLGHHLEKGC